MTGALRRGDTDTGTPCKEGGRGGSDAVKVKECLETQEAGAEAWNDFSSSPALPAL